MLAIIDTPAAWRVLTYFTAQSSEAVATLAEDAVVFVIDTVAAVLTANVVALMTHRVVALALVTAVVIAAFISVAARVAVFIHVITGVADVTAQAFAGLDRAARRICQQSMVPSDYQTDTRSVVCRHQ